MIIELFDRLIPDDADAKAVMRWRILVGSIEALLLLFCILITYIAFAGVPGHGYIAWTKDVNKLVEERAAPLEARLSTLEEAVRAQQKTTESLLARVAEGQLDYLIKRRCNTKDDEELEFLTREIRRYEEDYENYKGRVFRIPSCGELKYIDRINRGETGNGGG